MSEAQPPVENDENEKAKVSWKERLKPKKKEPAIPIGENIEVSLIPDSHKRNVEARKAKNNWTIIFGLTVLVGVVAGFLMFAYNLQLQTQLESERRQQETIDLSISRHAEVHQALESEKIAQQLLGTSAGNEIDWSRLVSTIEQQLPQGTEITSLSVTNGGLINDEVSSSITLNLTSDSTFGYSDSLRAIENISGVEQVEIGGLAVSGEGGYTYRMSFTYDTSILTERFSMEEAPTTEAPAEETPPVDPAIEELSTDDILEEGE